MKLGNTGKEQNKMGNWTGELTKAADSQTIFTRVDELIGHRWTQKEGQESSPREEMESKTGHTRAELQNKTGNNKTTTIDRKAKFESQQKTVRKIYWFQK